MDPKVKRYEFYKLIKCNKSLKIGKRSQIILAVNEIRKKRGKFIISHKFWALQMISRRRVTFPPIFEQILTYK